MPAVYNVPAFILRIWSHEDSKGGWELREVVLYMLEKLPCCERILGAGACMHNGGLQPPFATLQTQGMRLGML